MLLGKVAVGAERQRESRPAPGSKLIGAFRLLAVNIHSREANFIRGTLTSWTQRARIPRRMLMGNLSLGSEEERLEEEGLPYHCWYGPDLTFLK